MANGFILQIFLLWWGEEGKRSKWFQSCQAGDFTVLLFIPDAFLLIFSILASLDFTSVSIRHTF